MTMMTRRPESTVRGEVLGAELRRIRETAGLTLLEASESVGISPSHLSKLETGKRAHRIEDVASLCTVYRVFGQERRDLLEFARNSSELGYWQKRSLSFASKVGTLRVLESRATALFNFETMFVPGYLQTVPYMRAVMRGGMINDEEEIDRRVVARIQRQSGVRHRSVAVTAVVCEAALRTQIGGTAIMRDQLKHVVEAAARPNVTFQVVPNSVGMHPGLEGPFLRLRFADRPGVVFLGCGDGSSLIFEEPEDIEYYKVVTAALLGVALSPQESVALVSGIAAELE
ncbi:helix-turn-helix transcriptional regulator [Actinophytocola sp.]|uniref:helix-turn-helix domain-containing protein n=1 Tax=Actinophytocola sp. TaxID=1872138 RepID=UPI002ECFB4CE